MFGERWREPPSEPWVWDKHPFAVGNCVMEPPVKQFRWTVLEHDTPVIRENDEKLIDEQQEQRQELQEEVSGRTHNRRCTEFARCCRTNALDMSARCTVGPPRRDRAGRAGSAGRQAFAHQQFWWAQPQQC